MRPDPSSRRATANLSLAETLLAEARALDINLSRAAETGIATAVAEEKARRWRQENREAIEHYNAWVEENGLPLEAHRVF